MKPEHTVHSLFVFVFFFWLSHNTWNQICWRTDCLNVWIHRSCGWAAEGEDHQCPGYSCPCWSCYTLWYWILWLRPQAAVEGYQTAQRKGKISVKKNNNNKKKNYFSQDQHPALSLHVATVWIFACNKVSLVELLLSVEVRLKTSNTLLGASDKHVYSSGL